MFFYTERAIVSFSHTKWLTLSYMIAGALCGMTTFVRGDMHVTAAFQIPHEVQKQMPLEKNAEINEAKKLVDDYGSNLFVYIHNQSEQRVGLKDVQWDDKTLTQWKENYEVVWLRMTPEVIEPGQEAELAICLRTALKKDTSLQVSFDQEITLTAAVTAAKPDFLLEKIVFEKNLKRAYLYVVRQNLSAPLPTRVYLDGHLQEDAALRWLSEDYTVAMRIAQLDFETPLDRGTPYTFRVAAENGATAAATLRAYADLTVFGTYGGNDLSRYAKNGLTALNSFRAADKALLDQAASLNVRIASMLEPKPDPLTYGHKGLYAYVLTDEPDVKDWGVDDRPAHKRVGAHAPDMVKLTQDCRVDVATPTLVTLDLTFTPYNYFFYGRIADITNVDCYPLTVGMPLSVIRDYLTIVRNAASPGPFTFSYQGCWEEYGIDQEWRSSDKIKEVGWDALRDKNKKRGLGRKPEPQEVRIQMFYAIGNGARGLFSYIDSSEMGNGVLYHGSEDLPELWVEIGRTSQMLNQVTPWLNIAYPVTWATANHDKIWLRTLCCGSQAALVVAVNEDYVYSAEIFAQNPLKNVTMTFNDMPWLRAEQVYRVTADKLEALEVRRVERGAVWSDDIATGEVYLITADPSLADN